jgi:hypothetical protein
MYTMCLRSPSVSLQPASFWLLLVLVAVVSVTTAFGEGQVQATRQFLASFRFLSISICSFCIFVHSYSLSVLCVLYLVTH